MRLLILFVMVVSAVGTTAGRAAQKASDGDSESTESVFEFYEFPAHPKLTHLCQERVYGKAGHEITWDAFASPARPSQVVAYYRRKLGDAGFTKEGQGGRWSLPADAESPRRILEVSRVGADNPARQCEKRPPAGSRSIILLSRRMSQ